MTWTTPEAIAAQLLKRWNRGELLAARVTGEQLFPLRLRVKRPTAREIADRFGAVQDWARALTAASRAVRGFGFELERAPVVSRVHGANEVPVAAIVPTEADALRLIRQQAAADRFQSLVAATLPRYPVLRDWLARRPFAALEHAEHWPKVLCVLDWFAAHPRPGLFLRQLDIPGVDTKFVEAHRALFTELLDRALPASAVDTSAVGTRRFNERFGLRSEPPLVRFRLLDPALYVYGLSDLSVLPEEFAGLDVAVGRVFITENRVNGLAFPDHPRSMVIFGLGYGLDRLAQIGWLRAVEVHYWGDIDTHGFGILNRLRAALPRARSFLMDRETLEAHRELLGQEPPDKRYMGEISRLTAEERALFENLSSGRWGERARLEQERIGYGCVEQALTKLRER